MLDKLWSNGAMQSDVTDAGLTGMGMGSEPPPHGEDPLPPLYDEALPEDLMKEQLLDIRNGKALADPMHKISLRSRAEREIVNDAKLKRVVSQMCEDQYLGADRSEDSLANLRGLQYLDLCGCNRITDVSMKHAFFFRELQYLNLSQCQQISFIGLSFLAARNPSIETLIMSQCYNVTDNGIISVSKFLSRLKHLEVQIIYHLCNLVVTDPEVLGSIPSAGSGTEAAQSSSEAGHRQSVNWGTLTLPQAWSRARQQALVRPTLSLTSMLVSAVILSGEFRHKSETENKSGDLYVTLVASFSLKNLSLFASTNRTKDTPVPISALISSRVKEVNTINTSMACFVKGCNQLTDASLAALGNYCCAIKYLDISNCYGMTLENADKMEAILPSLQTLHRRSVWSRDRGFERSKVVVPAPPDIRFLLRR
uniref:F-box/LRR-repeat protein 15-like leucin rich repeat domain-containing protein n=1 Tax=Timema monikensis TaxID=170555 RepID=A0A7R9HUN1_9NEOP|nr:unnamed protein product [Timema monikensis]